MPFLEHVDPLIGTDSHHGFSTGNCLPLCAAPFGMTAWSPQTAEGGWFFDRRERKLMGICTTHQPSPWIGDYGRVTICPQIGEVSVRGRSRSSAYRLDRSTVKPHHQKFEFIRYRTQVELSSTKRCGHLVFEFPAHEIGRVIFDPAKGSGEISVDRENGCVYGITRGNSGGCKEGYGFYFYAEFSKPIHGHGVFDSGSDPHEAATLAGERAGVYVEFEAGAKPLEVKFGTSFISVHQARINLAREIGNASFDETLERAGRVWEENLGRIEVETSNETHRKLFYTCLYRTQLFPRIFDEEDENNQLIHYSPYCDEVRPGPMVTDNGFWDTYRTIYPLFALMEPSRLAGILEGWVNTYKEGGWFPQWASPGYRACMVGTHIDVVMADAVSRGVTDFDLETAFEGLLKHAYHPGDADGNYGRIGIKDYIDLGYVAHERHDSSVARSLDYAYDDWCIATIADYLGRSQEGEALRSRSQNYRKLWDSTSGFMRARDASGKFAEPFDPITWGDPYVEGGAWQSTWAVPHDISGLIDLTGGAEAFVAKLETMLTMKPEFNVGTYRFEIHEMTEMACADFGQYAQSNQPVHHVLYLFTAAGRPDRTQYWVDRILRELYTEAMFPGDEDNGEMSAWFVLSSLGIFPLTPGNGKWTFGTTLFDRAKLHLEDGHVVELRSTGDPKVPTIREIQVDGTAHSSREISHADLIKATSIEFVRG